MENIVSLKNFQVRIMTTRGVVDAVRGVNLDIEKGELHGIVGESGCGKSMTIKSIMRLHDERHMEYGGQIMYGDKDILQMSEKELDEIRGKGISMIFQDPMVSLNPIMKAGEQIAELIRKKEKVSRQEAKQKVLELFDRVGILPPEKRYEQYPFEMSGGMIQRVMIAMAISCNPSLLIADEPTTALDVTIQAQILEILKELQRKYQMSVIFVTHDLGVIAEICDRVSVMYAGKIVESGSILDIFDHPQHPYTKALLDSNPKEGQEEKYLVTIPGMPPSLYDHFEGCSFAPRCKYATEECRKKEPELTQKGEKHIAACFHSEMVSPSETKGE